jgi:predicted nucleic acid-binding protein
LLDHHGGHLLTTNHVRGEAWTLINRREGHRAATAFLDVLARSPRLRVEHVSEALEHRALDWLRKRDDREFSFVDAASFVTMTHLGIREALAFDGDFTAAGFVELR